MTIITIITTILLSTSLHFRNIIQVLLNTFDCGNCDSNGNDDDDNQNNNNSNNNNNNNNNDNINKNNNNKIYLCNMM